MQVVTKAIISKPPDKLWPLLCSSRMDPEIPCLFRFGIPKPVECRLPDGVGGVGHQRQCVSDRGIINQRIIQWDEPNTLRFEMEDTNLYFRPCIDSIIEEFQLKAISHEFGQKSGSSGSFSVQGQGRVGTRKSSQFSRPPSIGPELTGWDFPAGPDAR